MEESQLRSMFTGSRTIIAVLALVSALTFLAGCVPKATGERTPVEVDPVPSTGYADLVLYFGDDQAMEVLPEKRRVEVPGDPGQRESTAALVVKELLKGPTDPLLSKTLPPEAKLLSIEVANGVAYANFSKEIQTKHWGGSAGESMSILSLVNSLTQIEPLTSSSAIVKVQILVEGKTVESLAGHFDISKPLSSAIRTDTPFFTSEERASELQKRVDAGQDEWRKDPLEVARFEAPSRGLHPELEYRQASSREGTAVVLVDAGEEAYTISLAQPVKKGAGGIWVITEIDPR